MIDVMHPPSFDPDYMEDWNLWVLDNGLPAPPPTVRFGESVPIVRWSGPRFGAVLHVERDDEEGEDYLSTETQVYRRTRRGWEASNGSGGSNWPGPNLGPPELPPRHVHFGHLHCSGDSGCCAAADGIAGWQAAVVELEDEDGITRRPIESPLRAFIVAFDAQRLATVRVLDEFEAVIAEHRFDPWPRLSL